jgi:hypothetical protein
MTKTTIIIQILDTAEEVYLPAFIKMTIPQIPITMQRIYNRKS